MIKLSSINSFKSMWVNMYRIWITITIQTFKKRQRALKDIDKCEIVLFLSIQNNPKPMMVIFFGIFLNKKITNLRIDNGGGCVFVWQIDTETLNNWLSPNFGQPFYSTDSKITSSVLGMTKRQLDRPYLCDLMIITSLKTQNVIA